MFYANCCNKDGVDVGDLAYRIMYELVKTQPNFSNKLIRELCGCAKEVAMKVLETLSPSNLMQLFSVDTAEAVPGRTRRKPPRPNVSVGQRLTHGWTFQECNKALEQIRFNRSEPVEGRRGGSTCEVCGSVPSLWCL